MFAVLGAIVLVTLLGAVGLTLAEKDQRLSGDFAALKSADEMGLAGLRLAVNRLEADPANLVVLLNNFITSKGSLSWLDFSGTTVTLQASAPGTPFHLSTDPNDKSSANVRILAVSPGDTSTGFPGLDSGMVYVTFECQATGLHNDQRTTTATYHIQGLSLAFSTGIRQFRIPNYAFYLGGQLQTSNLAATITGDVYINGSDGTFFNGNAAHTINGTLKWRGDFSTNAALTVDSNVFISGSLTLNASAPLTFNGNLGVSGGLKQMNSKLKVAKNLWVGSTFPTPSATNWNAGGMLDVGGDLMFIPSSAITVGDSIHVGGNAWFMTGIAKNGNRGISIGKHLFIHDSAGFSNTFRIELASRLEVGKNLVCNVVPPGMNPPTFQLSGGASVYVKDTLISMLAITGGTAAADSMAYATGGVGGNIVVDSGKRAKQGLTSLSFLTSHYAAPPLPKDMGLDTNTQNTTVQANPMDSVKLDSINSPEVYSRIVEVTSKLLSDANITSSVMNPNALNRLYSYLDSTGRTYNGYMVLRLSSKTASAFTSSSDDVVGFKGKAIYLVTGNNANLAEWPHSNTEANIQIIDIQPGGDLGSWGWRFGDFAGMFYWSDPPAKYCTTNKTFNFPNGVGQRFLGSIIIGSALSAKCDGPRITPNNGAISLIRSVAVYTDIGTNLPGLLRPAKLPDNTYRPMTTSTVQVMSPFVRQTTSKPYFQTMGIYR